MTEQNRVAIIGAGVAGLCSAWLLARQGWHCTILEKAPDLRAGGYMMGLSGPGYKAAEHMQLLPDLKPFDRMINENVYYNRHGKELLRVAYHELLQDMNWLTLARTDLVAALYQRIQNDCPEVEIRFGTSLISFTETEDQVHLELSDQNRLTADLLLGADGVNSQLRTLMFGEQASHSEYMGYQVAGFQAPDTLKLGHDFLSYAEPGRVAEFYQLYNERMATLYIWRSDQPVPATRAEKLQHLKQAFTNSHPQALLWLEQLADDEPLFYDSMRMITLPQWHKGRVMLMGDAAHCLTLLSGQGAGMALVSAYLLEQQLREKPIAQALQEHETIMRPAVLRLQARSRKIAPWFIPNSRLGFHLRNLFMCSLPKKWLGNYFLKAMREDIAAAARGLNLQD